MTSPTPSEELQTALHRLIVENRSIDGKIYISDQAIMADEIFDLIRTTILSCKPAKKDTWVNKELATENQIRMKFQEYGYNLGVEAAFTAILGRLRGDK